MLFELSISRKEHPVTPSWNTHFLGSVIHLTVVVVFIGWVEVKLALIKLVQDHVALFYL